MEGRADPSLSPSIQYATRGGDFYQLRGSTKKREGQKKAKRFPRRATKDGKGPLRGWREKARQRGSPRKRRSTKRAPKEKRYPRRATKNGKGPLRGWRGLERERGSPRVHEKGHGKRKDFHQAGPRRTGKGKKISTKGHEGRQRATKALARGRQEGFDIQRSGRGERISTKRVHEGREKAKRFPRRGSVKDIKGKRVIHEGARRTALRGPGRITAYFTNRFHSSLP